MQAAPAADFVLARGFKSLNPPLLLLVACARFRFIRAAEAEIAPVNRNVNVLGKSLDDLEHL
jgi:hypothetical protein